MTSNFSGRCAVFLGLVLGLVMTIDTRSGSTLEQAEDPPGFTVVPPLGLDLYLPAPPDNPITTEKLRLGQRLFVEDAPLR